MSILRIAKAPVVAVALSATVMEAVQVMKTPTWVLSS